MSSTRILVIGDPHFKVDNLEEMKEMTSSILKILRDDPPDAVVVLGDTLDRHSSIHMIPLSTAIAFLREIVTITELILLIGNHDRKNNNDFLSSEHPFTALELWPSTLVVNSTAQKEINGHLFTFVPYVAPGRFLEALNQVEKWQNSTAIFAHQEFYGCKMGAITSEIGDRWPPNYPLVISGHIHEYQQVQANLLYVGTPIQHGYGDTDRKSISLFTFTSSWQEERISLTVKRKEILRLTVAEVNSISLQDEKRLKIIIQGTAAELKAISKHPKLTLWRSLYYKVQLKQVRQKVENEPSLSEAPPAFSKALFERCSVDDDLLFAYREVFGGTIRRLIIKRS